MSITTTPHRSHHCSLLTCGYLRPAARAWLILLCLVAMATIVAST